MTDVTSLSTVNARLPESYERARQALSECSSIDEVKDWADKAAALASYARQANDKTLEKYAIRIRSRAIRQAGILLKQFDGRGGDRHSEHFKSKGDYTFEKTQTQAAKEAGMSKHQQTTAVRVANVDENEFDSLVESDEPPTLTELAQKGKTYLEKEKPQGFKEATNFIGTLKRMIECVKDKELLIISGLSEQESQSVRRQIKILDKSMDMIFVNLK